MSNFRLLSRTRQITEYSCGASAMQTVLGYWGRDVDETELMRLIDTTSEEGTYPENLVKGARALGFEAEVRENLTLDELRAFTDAGHPAIGLGQVWRSESASPGPATEDWDDGHYIVITGVDDDFVYFQDPYVRMSKAVVARGLFEDHWHQKMGGAATKNRELKHLAIFVRGTAPARAPSAEAPSLAALDFSRFGSLHLLTLRFSRFILPFDLMDAARGLWAEGNVRANAFLCLRKDAAGNIAGIEGSQLTDDEDVAATNAIIGAMAARSLGRPETTLARAEEAVAAATGGDFGLSAEELLGLARTLEPGHSTIFLLVENLWERKLREIVGRHGGAIVGERLMSSGELEEAVRRLRAA